MAIKAGGGDLQEKVYGVIAEFASKKAHEIADEQKLNQDLYFDELDRIELTIALEEEFTEICIKDDEMYAWVTARDVFECVEKKVDAADRTKNVNTKEDNFAPQGREPGQE